MREPDQWDYDPATNTITTTGEVVPRTCPRDLHEFETLYEVATSTANMLDRGWRTIDDIDAQYLNIVLYVDRLNARESEREAKRELR